MAKIYILPNGKKVKVDSNIGKAGAIDIAVRNGIMTRDEAGYDPEVGASDDSSFGQNLLEGTGRGMANIGRNVANLALPKSLEEKWGFTDEDLKEANRLDESLMSTGGGMIGSAIGETALTLPVGGAALAGAKAGARGLQAARGAAQAARGAGVGGRVGAGQLAAAGALEGAGVGALAAGPDERLEGAAWGAGAGGLMSGAGSGLRRVREGLAKTDEISGDLIEAAASRDINLEIPVADAAKKGGLSGMIRGLYQSLPYIPGSGKTMERYANTTARDFSEMVVQDAAPEGFEATLKGGKRNVQEVVKDMSAHYKQTFSDTIEQYKFNTKGDFLESAYRQLDAEDIADGVKGMARNKLDDLLRKYADDGILDGADIGRIKAQLSTASAEAADNQLGTAYRSVSRGLDDMVSDQLGDAGTDAAEDLLKYNDLIARYGHFMDLESASYKAKAPGGMFDAKEYLSVVKSRNTKQDLARGMGRNQGLAEAAATRIGKPTKKSGLASIPGRVAAYAILGGSGFGGPGGVAAMMTMSRALAGPTAQRFMLGNSGFQKGLANLLKAGKPLPDLIQKKLTPRQLKLLGEIRPGGATTEVVGDILRRGAAATAAEKQR